MPCRNTNFSNPCIIGLFVVIWLSLIPTTQPHRPVSSLSHPAADLTEADDIVYKFHLSGCAWVFLYQSLVLALPILKLMHTTVVSTWPWLWVTVFFWGPGALLALVLALEWVEELRKPKAIRVPLVLAAA